MIGVLENPHFSSAFGGVKLCHRPENFQENALHDVFGFSGIADDFESNAEDKAVVAVEQDGQSVVATALQLRHQLGILQSLQLGESWRLNRTCKGGAGGREFGFSQRTVPVALSPAGG